MAGISNSVVIVNFNSRVALLALLKSLALHEATSTEVIVVDSASTDGSVEAAREACPQAKVMRLETNRGFYAAVNKGIDRAEGDVAIVCHADVIADIHTLAELGDQARETEGRKVAAVVPRLVGVDGAEQPFVATLPKLATGVAGALNPVAAWQSRVPFLDHLAENEWARFACVALSQNYLATTGAFDPRFFLYYGDADQCSRIHAKHLRVLISKTVKVTHAGASLAKDFPPHLLRILRKDQEQYAQKHFPSWQQGVVRAAGTVGRWFANSD
ncbi:MAG TPA: glycosyltransferase family 2 protein [Tepidisphaeraceae bacterium]|nr:glycosyltransferase family 2 protein [Tepidisphaeraceae bacterium]